MVNKSWCFKTSVHVWRFLSFHSVILLWEVFTCGVKSKWSILQPSFTRPPNLSRPGRHSPRTGHHVNRWLSERSNSDKDKEWASGCQHLKSLVWPQAINRVCLYKVEQITVSLNKTLTSKPIPPSASDYLKWLHSPCSERKRSLIHCASSHWWGFEEGGQVVVKEENGNQQLSLLMQVMSCGIVKANFVYTLGEKRVYFSFKSNKIPHEALTIQKLKKNIIIL